MILFNLFSQEKQTEPIPPLDQSISRAFHEWKWAQEMFHSMPGDDEMVDYSIYLIKATERRYVYLLKQARQESLHCSLYRLEEF